MRIREVIDHVDVPVPTTGNILTTKIVKAHGVAHYVFTLEKTANLIE